MKHIGIVGSRRRDGLKDYHVVREAFDVVYEVGDIIVSGGCPKGGDRFAENIAEEKGVPTIIFNANWRLGRHAGFLRNTDIANKSDVLIACVAEDREGGTEDTIRKFVEEHGIDGLILV